MFHAIVGFLFELLPRPSVLAASVLTNDKQGSTVAVVSACTCTFAFSVVFRVLFAITPCFGKCIIGAEEFRFAMLGWGALWQRAFLLVPNVFAKLIFVRYMYLLVLFWQ